MARLGMDVDAVERVGRELQAQAGELAELVGRMDRLVAGLPGTWEGATARRFTTEWWPTHRSALLRSGDAVRRLGQSALNNAAEQREISGSTGTPALAGAGSVGGLNLDGIVRGPGVGPGSVGGFHLHGVVSGSGARSGGPLDLPLGMLDELQAIRFPPNNYSLYDVASLAASAQGIGVFDVISDLQTAGTFVNSLASGEFSLIEAADLVGAVMTKAPVPAAALGGVALQAWAEVGRLAQESDFSPETLERNLEFIREEPWGAASGAAEAVVSYLPKVGKTALDAAKAYFKIPG